MNNYLKFIFSLSLSFLFTLCVGFLIFMGILSYDIYTDNNLISIIIPEESQDEYVEANVIEFVEREDWQGLRLWAQKHGIEYHVSNNRGRPLVTSEEYYTREEVVFFLDIPNIKVSSEKEPGTYYAHAYVAQTPNDVYERNLFLYNVKRAFFESTLLLVIAFLFPTIVLVLCLWALIQYATPAFKLGLATFYILAIEYAGIFLIEKPIGAKLYLFFAAEKLLLFLIALSYLFFLGKIHKKIRAIGKESPEKAEEKQKKVFLPFSLRSFMADVQHASRNIQEAVNEQMKSERLKTELISNVSHDIKTPLTSIINFSDLISKENSENPVITEYANHLHSQSLRLKNLLESLIEASKASCGAVEIQMVPCRIRTLLEQCMVEYEEKLKMSQIELIELSSQEELTIMADTNALCRIFDNLLTNISRYALPGSRAYLETKKEDGKVSIIFRNISKEPCNLSPEELTERFVRGDTSRHSEGHGLGLSIVKSLMDLMNGTLIIDSKYDLFEITLSFPEFTPQ